MDDSCGDVTGLSECAWYGRERECLKGHERGQTASEVPFTKEGLSNLEIS